MRNGKQIQGAGLHDFGRDAEDLFLGAVGRLVLLAESALLVAVLSTPVFFVLARFVDLGGVLVGFVAGAELLVATAAGLAGGFF